MKRIYLFALITIIMIGISGKNGFAQEKRGHYFTVTTWKLTIPDNGSTAQLDSLLKVWHDKVVMKNDKVISEKVFRHNWGHDMRDWVYVTEYATWNDIEAAGENQNKLIEAAWPDKKERHEFFKKMNKYMVTHSDEIYQELPDLGK